MIRLTCTVDKTIKVCMTTEILKLFNRMSGKQFAIKLNLKIFT